MKTQSKTKPKMKKNDMHIFVQRVRWAYIRQRRWHEQIWGSGKSDYLPGPRWDGGDRRGSRRSNIWVGAAQAMIDVGVDWPEEYVAWQFDQSFGKLIRPNQLYTEARIRGFVDAARQRKKKRTNTVSIRLHSQAAALDADISFWEDGNEMSKEDGDSECDYTQPLLIALGTTGNQLSPLFRHLVSRYYNIQDYADTFCVAAAFQYMPDARYYDFA